MTNQPQQHKQLPQNIDAEKSLLGSLLVDKNAIYKIIDTIEAGDFYEIKHGTIYQGYLDLIGQNTKVDMVTLSNNLSSKGLLESVGGAGYLAELFNFIGSMWNIEDYAAIVKDKSIRRNILVAQEKNEKDVFKEDTETDDLLATVQNRIYDLSPRKKQSDTIRAILGDLESIQEEYGRKYEQGKKIIGFSCGMETIDDIIDGVRPGHLWVIGAWHGTGKTSFALNILHSLLEQQIASSIISTEMSQVDLAAKLIGIRHDLSSMKVLKGRLDTETASNISEGKAFLKQADLEIHNEFDFEKIKMLIRKDVYRRGVKVFVIDYIQKITHKKIYEETPLMARIAQELSNLAQDLKITIILLSQISNEAHKGSGAGAGYKGSGAIEASADFAIVLKRDKTQEAPDAESVPMNVQITKNKFGLDGTISMWFHLKSGKISEVSPSYIPSVNF